MLLNNFHLQNSKFQGHTFIFFQNTLPHCTHQQRPNISLPWFLDKVIAFSKRKTLCILYQMTRKWKDTHSIRKFYFSIPTVSIRRTDMIVLSYWFLCYCSEIRKFWPQEIVEKTLAYRCVPYYTLHFNEAF